jgi:uncharacterized membrane protein YkoI
MKLRGIITAGACAVVAVSALAFQPGAGGDYGKKEDDSKLLAALPKSKHTLEDGIKQAAKGSEVPISAKFEMDDDEGKNELSLSVYVAEKGLGVNAEQNVFKELGGDPEGAAWKPEVEVFKDVEHVSRSAEQLTIMALSKMTLAEVIAKAQKDQSGTVYSVNPKMRDRKAVFVVLVANQGKSVELAYDAITGAAVKK